MKRKAIEWVAMIAVIVGLVILLGRVGWYETHYTMTGRITAIEAEEIIVTTDDGNVWAFNGDGFAEQDLVEITLFTNGTDLNKYDDEIEAVKKIA